jgi:hypothetical protein
MGYSLGDYIKQQTAKSADWKKDGEITFYLLKNASAQFEDRVLHNFPIVDDGNIVRKFVICQKFSCPVCDFTNACTQLDVDEPVLRLDTGTKEEVWTAGEIVGKTTSKVEFWKKLQGRKQILVPVVQTNCDPPKHTILELTKDPMDKLSDTVSKTMKHAQKKHGDASLGDPQVNPYEILMTYNKAATSPGNYYSVQKSFDEEGPSTEVSELVEQDFKVPDTWVKPTDPEKIKGWIRESVCNQLVASQILGDVSYEDAAVPSGNATKKKAFTKKKAAPKKDDDPVESDDNPFA